MPRIDLLPPLRNLELLFSYLATNFNRIADEFEKLKDPPADEKLIKRWTFTWASGDIKTLANADGLTYGGAVFISADGDNQPGAALLSFYRQGTWNVLATGGHTGGWTFGNLTDPGTGLYRCWLGGSGADAPLTFQNVGGATRVVTVMQVQV